MENRQQTASTIPPVILRGSCCRSCRSSFDEGAAQQYPLGHPRPDGRGVLSSLLHRLNFQVAAEAMGPDLGLSLVQMGWVFAAFNYSYAFFQLSGGVWGGRLGSRLSLTPLLLAWTAITLLTGLLPGLAGTSTVAIFGTLIGLRFLMGIVQAPLFPAMAGTVEAWFPV